MSSPFSYTDPPCVCMSVCVNLIQATGRNVREILMKFAVLTCFDPRRNAIGNGLDLSNFSIEKNFNFQNFKILP